MHKGQVNPIIMVFANRCSYVVQNVPKYITPNQFKDFGEKAIKNRDCTLEYIPIGIVLVNQTIPIFAKVCKGLQRFSKPIIVPDLL